MRIISVPSGDWLKVAGFDWLTAGQRLVLGSLYTAADGSPAVPFGLSMPEISAQTGLREGSVWIILNLLEEKKVIRRLPRKPGREKRRYQFTAAFLKKLMAGK